MRYSWGIFLLWVAALVFALITGRDLAFNLLYFMSAVIALALFWAWSNRRGLVLKRATRTQRSQVGKYFEEALELANNSRWPKLWVEVFDASTLPGHHVSRVVNSLGRHSTFRWQVRTLCRRRGRFTLGPTTLTSGDPLGIFRFTRAIPQTTTLVVAPATVAIAQFSPPTGYLPGGETLRRRTPYVTTSVAGVHDYVPGDSFNRIHWPSTARMGRLISKEFELDPLADVWLFLDMYGDAHAEAPFEEPEEDILMPWLTRRAERVTLPPSTVEYSVTIAASLAQHFLQSDREVGFLSYAESRQIVQPDRGERQLNRLLEILAVIQPRGRVPLAQVLAGEGTGLGRHMTVIVITPSTDSRWVTALRGLRARGVHGVAVLLAARTFGPAPDWNPIVAELQASGVTAYLVKNGDDLAVALGQPISGLVPGGVRF
ncbi:MAG: DUF58 domain-containing protein [Anaerolineae bacterium]